MRGWWGITVAAALVFGQGCAVVVVREISRTELESAAPTALDEDGYVSLAAVRVAVAARNDRISTLVFGPAIMVPLPIVPVTIGEPVERGPHFWIDVAIDPEGEAFTFDPGEVRLHLEPGSSLAPSLVLGPAAVLRRASRRHSEQLCGFDPTDGSGVVARVSLIERCCFSLRFDIVPPAPDASFTMSLRGLANAGQPVAVPTMRFIKGHDSTLEALP